MSTSSTRSTMVRPATQRGVTLVVGLIMLLILTLFAVSAIRLSSANLRTVGNAQARAEAASAAQQAIEQSMSNIESFTEPAARPDIPITVNGTEYLVDVETPVCVLTQPVLGNSYDNATLALQDTYWDVAATATDARTGASVRIHQGVRVRLDAAADCPP